MYTLEWNNMLLFYGAVIKWTYWEYVDLGWSPPFLAENNRKQTSTKSSGWLTMAGPSPGSSLCSAGSSSVVRITPSVACCPGWSREKGKIKGRSWPETYVYMKICPPPQLRWWLSCKVEVMNSEIPFLQHYQVATSCKIKRWTVDSTKQGSCSTSVFFPMSSKPGFGNTKMTQWHHINLWNQLLVCYPILKVEGGILNPHPPAMLKWKALWLKDLKQM